MSVSFDPYYTWLGIPPGEQPANHYRLLGLKVFETNAEAISNAADRQMMLLRTYQSGEHSALSQKLLNEIASVRVCLLNAEKKAAYDALLRRELGAIQATSESPEPTVPEGASGGGTPNFDIRPIVSERDNYTGRSGRGRSRVGWKTLVALGVVAVVTLVMVGAFLRSSSREDDQLPGKEIAGGKSLQDASVDSPPVLASIADQTVQVGQAWQLAVAVDDPGSDEGLIFRLEPSVPAGMEIDRTTGLITWLPGEEQRPGDYLVTVTVVSDAVGAPTAQQSFRIHLETAIEPAVSETSGLAGESSELTESEDSKVANLMPAPTPQVEPMPEPKMPDVVAKTVAPEEKLQRLPVPGDSAREQSLQAVRERFDKVYGSKSRHVRLGLAALLIGESRKLADAPTERYVLLEEARDLAVQEGDLTLGLVAVEELAEHFLVDSVVLKGEVVRSSVRAASTPAALRWPVEAAVAVAREAITADSFDEAMSLLRVAGASAKGTNLGESVLVQQKVAQYARQLYEESRPASAALADDPSDAEANLTLGRFHCLALGDWETGLTMLAQSSDEMLKGHARSLVADPLDTAAQLGFGDAWWEMAEKQRGTNEEKSILRNAARYWYERAQPRLTGPARAKAQTRMKPVVLQERRTAQRPYQLSMGGLAGLSNLLPAKVTGKVSSGGGFANILGKCRIEYPRVPPTSYIHEFEFTLAKPQGTFTLHYGGAKQGVKIAFEWASEVGAFRCRLFRWGNGVLWWSNEREYRPGETLRFTYYVNEDERMLYQNGTSIWSSHAAPVALQFTLIGGVGSAVNLSYCAFRPWTETDARSRRCGMPPVRVEGDVAQTAIRWHGSNVDLGDSPIVKSPEPYVVDTTGTPMQWVEAGSFRRTYPGAAPPRSPTEVVISRGFWIGRHEVTQAEWARLMPQVVSPATGSPFLPVAGVRWEDAARFCVLLSEREKKGRRLPAGYVYRLPTEAEWEYACRAGSSEPFCTDRKDFWSKERSDRHPHEVGTSTANAWGIFDMHGNVGEWCCEKYQELPVDTPFQLVDPFLPPSGKDDLLCRRGGGWWREEAAASCSWRGGDLSEDSGYTGFRIVLGPTLRAK